MLWENMDPGSLNRHRFRVNAIALEYEVSDERRVARIKYLREAGQIVRWKTRGVGGPRRRAVSLRVKARQTR
jgi:hypothetical protein